VMLVLLIILLTVGVTALVTLAALQGRDSYREHRAEAARIERQKRLAERRLHDMSSKAFESMLDATRQPARTDAPWWS
jgi:hypothetical protein